MHIHYLKHVPFEGLGSIENLLVENGCDITRTCMYQDQSLPSIHEIDALFIMGGPMGVYDDDEYPWLTLEKEFIESVLQLNIPILGVCLGAQLLASVLGAKVENNTFEEIGWYPVKRTKGLVDDRVNNLPIDFDALHWHGDTFEIPDGGSNFIVSDGCANQAFVYGENVLGMQFHLEMLPSNVEAIYQECGKPDKTGRYIQTLQEMLEPSEKYQQATKTLKQVIEAFIFNRMTP